MSFTVNNPQKSTVFRGTIFSVLTCFSCNFASCEINIIVRMVLLERRLTSYVIIYWSPFSTYSQKKSFFNLISTEKNRGMMM